jgi:geranylgeranyl pyrophosphate synthase
MIKNEPLNLDDFFDSTRNDVEKKIADTIKDEKIKSILQGGKRLRSFLAHLSFKVCTKGEETHSQFQKALEGTVGIELAHAASLVHDDIIDKDFERRGKTAFHIKEGIAHAILIGHKMLTTSFNIALSHGKEVAKLYVDSWNEVVNGELDEVNYNKTPLKLKSMSTKSDIFQAYHKIIDMKTASLFSSACKAGALEADMSGDILKVFADYGREIGLAYQLADDLVDLTNGEMIESVIVPLLNKLERKTTKAVSLTDTEIKEKFEKNKDKIQKFYVEEIKKHVTKAEKLSKSDTIPKSSYKDLLVETPSYIVNRMLGQVNLTI